MSIKNRFKQIGLLFFLGASMTIISCDKDADNILEEEGISFDDLYGKWSIATESEIVTDPSGAEVENEVENFEHNRLTIEFKNNGTFLFIDVKEGDWENGAFTLNELESKIDLEFDVEGETLTIEDLTSTSAKFSIVEEEIENGVTLTSTSTVTLVKNTGNEPGIDATDLKRRWSMTSNEVSVDDTPISADIMDEQWLETVASIPSHRYTFDLTNSAEVLGVDNYMTGTYTEGELEVLDRSNFVLDLDGSDDDILFHITENTGASSLSVVHYQNTEDDVYVEVEQDWTSDFSTPALTAQLLDGNWEVTAKSEGREVNGQVATAVGEGPEVGNVITFYSNGSGTLGTDQFTFEFIDDNNMVLISAGETEYSLIHFESFNGTNEISIWNMNSAWNETSTEFHQEWLTLDLVKQE